MRLTGSLFARLSQERRRKVLMGINKDLAHMAEEDFKSVDTLFGEDAVDRIKKRHDAIKTLKHVRQPFRKGGTQRPNRFGRRESQGSHQYGHGPSQYRASPFRKTRFTNQRKGTAPPKKD